MSALRFTVLLAGAWCAAAQPIRLHPDNPHYFLYRGKAVALVSSGEHYGAVMNADFDYLRYLKTMAAEGMNYTRLFGGSYREVPGKSFGILRNDLAPAPERFLAPWARSQTPGYEGGGNKFDLDRWDAPYFARLHDFLAAAAERGIIVEITLFSSHYQEMQWKISALNAANNVNGTAAIDWKKLHTLENGNILGYQERYTRKLVREVNGFDNVTFEIQNEPWSDRTATVDVVNAYLPLPGRNLYPNAVDVADALSLAWQARVAEWIASEESGLSKRHLIAQNYCNFRFPAGKLAAGASIVNFHYAYPEAVTLNYGLGMAIANDETGFLGREDAPYRRQAWNFMLSGGSLFNGLDYSFSVGHEDGSDAEANGPGGGSAALRRQMKVLSDFLGQLHLETTRPAAAVVRHATGIYVRVLTDGEGSYAMYFDGRGPAEAAVNLPAGKYAAEWLDVESGKTARAESFRHAGGEKTLSTPGFADGMALRLKQIP